MMESLFNNRSLVLRLKKGLTTPNPENPDVPMWTLEDLDEPSPGFKANVEAANKNLRIFPRGYQGVRHQNLARENLAPEITESVEVIDPKDFPTNQTN